MAKIERFEELQSCQKARQLANAVYELTEHPKFAKDFRLCGQIQDAAGSVMHNVAEGFDAGTYPEFMRFLKIASVLPVKFNPNSTLLWIATTFLRKNSIKRISCGRV